MAADGRVNVPVVAYLLVRSIVPAPRKLARRPFCAAFQGGELLYVSSSLTDLTSRSRSRCPCGHPPEKGATKHHELAGK